MFGTTARFAAERQVDSLQTLIECLNRQLAEREMYSSMIVGGRDLDHSALPDHSAQVPPDGGSCGNVEQKQLLQGKRLPHALVVSDFNRNIEILVALEAREPCNERPDLLEFFIGIHWCFS